MRSTLLLRTFVVWLVWLQQGAVWGSLCFPCSVKQGGETTSAPRAGSQSKWTEGQGGAGSSAERETFPTRLQGTSDLFKYL